MTAFAKFDPRNIIAETLRELSMTVVAFAALQYESSVARWNIERALRGQRDLDQYEARDLTKLAKELRGIRDSFGCNLDWDDCHNVKQILRRRRDQERECAAKA